MAVTNLQSLGDSIVYVNANNTEGPWEGTFENPYRFIQDGIDDANPADTVSVAPGTYAEHVIVNKSVHLVGEDKDSTVIDGSAYVPGRRLATLLLYHVWRD